MFAFAPPRRRRKPALTPLIDVVFLLLVFFMLASQFGRENAVDLAGGAGAASPAYDGPPRLVTLLPGAVLLNGAAQDEAELIAALRALTTSADSTVLLRARDGATVQRLTDLAGRLTDAGFTRLIVVE